MPSDEYTTLQVNLRGMFASQLGRLTTTVDILGSSDDRSTHYQLLAEHHHANTKRYQAARMAKHKQQIKGQKPKVISFTAPGFILAHALPRPPTNTSRIALNVTNPKYHRITQSGHKYCASMTQRNLTSTMMRRHQNPFASLMPVNLSYSGAIMILSSLIIS